MGEEAGEAANKILKAYQLGTSIYYISTSWGMGYWVEKFWYFPLTYYNTIYD